MGHATAVEDKKLWDQWFASKSHDACDELIRRYMPLVHYHVQRISVGLPKNVQKDDLTSHGLMGLYDALEKFQPERDLKFDTYASFRIRGAIIDGLRKEDWLPRSMRDKIKKVESTMEKLEQRNGRFASSEEVAKELNMNAIEVEQVMTEYFTSNVLSIDERSQDTERNETYAATIEDKITKTPEQVLSELETKKELVKIIDQLPEKERLVISLFYYEELTLTEIGQVLNLSTSRISQIHSKSLFRLQQALKKGN
ncbi:FliA/WhiG family RNA polymerase sigma factor [Halalkalibacter akibai]|uniref:RNA polymerase sigma factor for flagellar operon n=1 Tax=Halalkalibacter akibai (strain ATCC 43226 / DSM 21942 / CIP 109018 / JCM 9157 / 1139) TaxID=1236973 RepID=W4QVY0_HALA3|nr:FliA/WhiG family RNA polymerase sigma factor [Halalkalibacter akibai]GAE36052.1 RNA polymerase sigma factor for flagellar operon [Halalkalibacter akibai JCM 9157]